MSSSPESSRRVLRTVRGLPTQDGAGVKLTRVIGTGELRNLDPFLMLDEFRSDEPSDYLAGFPSHPHRGFETFTYMLAGRFRHRDNQGNEGLLEAGGGQWMTAGRGIVHSEMPEQLEGLVWGFQLWINLPAKDKMTAPSYRDLHASMIPRVDLAHGASVRVVSGRFNQVVGPVAARATDPVFLEVAVPKGTDLTIPLPETHAGFVYLFDGRGCIGRSDVESQRGELSLLGEGSDVNIAASSTEGLRALVVAGKPLREPVVQHGPFVMNSASEIQRAILDYQGGRF